MLASSTYSKVLAPLVLCLIGCGGENDAAEAPISTFTGRLETADSVVGLAMSAKGDVDVYVCGGATTFATHSRWFSGSIASNEASFETAGVRLDLTLRGEKADIILTTPDGTVHSTVADKAGSESRSALYESTTDNACRWGAIVVDDGSAEPNVFGTWCHRTTPVASGEPEDIFAQVTPVQPIDFSKIILPVLASTPTGEQRFELRRVDASNASP